MHHSMMNIPHPSRGTASTWNDGFVQTPSADLCTTTTVPANKMVSLQARTCQSGIWTLVSESESTASGASTDDK